MGKILKTLDQLITGIGICSLFGLIVIAFIQVFFRYTLNNALPWPEEVCRFIFIILAYTGMAMTMRKNGHLRVDVLLSFVSPHVGKLLNILATFFTLLYCALGAWLTWDMLLAIKDMEQMASTVNIAVYITWIPIPVCLILTCLYAIIQLYAYATDTDISQIEGS